MIDCTNIVLRVQIGVRRTNGLIRATAYFGIDIFKYRAPGRLSSSELFTFIGRLWLVSLVVVLESCNAINPANGCGCGCGIVVQINFYSNYSLLQPRDISANER